MRLTRANFCALTLQKKIGEIQNPNGENVSHHVFLHHDKFQFKKPKTEIEIEIQSTRSSQNILGEG